MKKEKCTVIVLAAGQGKRMGTKIQKQFLEIQGKPILYYSLNLILTIFADSYTKYIVAPNSFFVKAFVNFRPFKNIDIPFFWIIRCIKEEKVI